MKGQGTVLQELSQGDVQPRYRKRDLCLPGVGEEESQWLLVQLLRGMNIIPQSTEGYKASHKRRNTFILK